MSIRQNTTRTSGKPSYVNFDIVFLPDNRTPVMFITPDDGDAFLEPVIEAGTRDNKVVWRSNRPFQIKCVLLQDPTKLLKSDEIYTEEKVGEWNDAGQVGKTQVWEYVLDLKASSGQEPKKTVVVKYSVTDVRSKVEFDPVLIITH